MTLSAYRPRLVLNESSSTTTRGRTRSSFLCPGLSIAGPCVFYALSCRLTNKKLNGSCGITPLNDDKGVMVLSKVEKANLLNKYIATVYTHDMMDLLTCKSPKALCSDGTRCLKVGVEEKTDLYFRPFTSAQVWREIRASLPPEKNQ